MFARSRAAPCQCTLPGSTTALHLMQFRGAPSPRFRLQAGAMHRFRLRLLSSLRDLQPGPLRRCLRLRLSSHRRHPLQHPLRHQRQRRRNPTLPAVQRAMTKWIRLRAPPAERNIAPGLAGSGIDSARASPSALSPGSAACTALATRATQTAWRCTRLRARRSQCPHPRLRRCARPTRTPTPHPRPQNSQPRTPFPGAWRRLEGRTSKAPCEGARPQPPIRPHTCQRHRPPHHRRRQRRRLWRHPPRRRRHKRTRLRRHRRRLRHCRTAVGRDPQRRAPALAAAPVPR